MPTDRKRIVIVGGGASGIELATRLARRLKARADITLVDRASSHFWKPRLHEVAAGLINANEDAVGYLAHGKQHGYRFEHGALATVDPARRVILLEETRSAVTGLPLLAGRELAYDILILAVGSRVNDFGVAGVRDHCHMLDSAEDASRVQMLLLDAAINSATRSGPYKVGIVGAGATGVEFAAELQHASANLQTYGGLGDPERLQIALIDQGSRVLPGADEKTSAAAASSLKAKGIDLMLGQGVAQATSEGLRLENGLFLNFDLMIWASGVVGHECVGSVPGLTIGRGRRIQVDDHLACVGVEGIYAIGDCAAAPAQDGRVPPTTAQVAHQQAGYLARALKHGLDGRKAKPFRYRPKGMLVSLGARQAAADLPLPTGQALTLEGPLPKLLYVSLFHAHRATLHGPLRALALFLSDRLRGLATPPIKLR